MAPPKKSDEEKRATKRAGYLRSRERYIARAQAWAEANPDKRREISRKSKEKNKERDNARARELRVANPGPERATRFRYRHGPFIAIDFATMRSAQGGDCYLCGRDLSDLPEAEIHIDHDHRCCPPSRSCRNCRRGLACKDCNSAIGFANDSPDQLRRMADALEAAQRRVNIVQLELLPETGS